MNVLVTGGAGFIGSAYVRHRLESHPEHAVRVLSLIHISEPTRPY